jgi:hypothetical protein
LEDEEVAILERVRAFGFSSNAGVIRPANPAWSGHSARLAADGQAEAEESRGKPRKAEESRGKPRKAEESRGKPRKAEESFGLKFDFTRSRPPLILPARSY